MAVEIRPVTFPDRLGSPESVEFERYAEFAIAIEIERWGDDRLADSPAEMLAMYRDEAYEKRQAFAAWDGDACVGRTVSWWERDPAAKTGTVIVEVAAGVPPSGPRQPPARARRGRDRRSRQVDLPGVGRLSDRAARPAGAAAVGPRRRRHDPGRTPQRAVRHASRLRHRAARTLECARGRRPRRRVPRRIGAARGGGIRLSHSSAGIDHVPDELVDSYAAARARMALDVPAGGLTIDEERWDADRVRVHESQATGGGAHPARAGRRRARRRRRRIHRARAAARQAGRLPIRHPRRRRPPWPRPRHAHEAREPGTPRPRWRPSARRSTRGTPTRTSTCSPSTSPWDSSRTACQPSSSAAEPHRRARGQAPSRTPRRAPPLAPRAPVRRPVHERLAHHGRAAARARQPGPPVGVQRVREVSGCPVDVDVLRVEARAALGERLGEHLAHGGEELARPAGG